jgi:hypothetical protein
LTVFRFAIRPLTLGLLILMIAWVPFLELLRRIVRRFRDEPLVDSSSCQALECRTDEYLKRGVGGAVDFREDSWEERQS